MLNAARVRKQCSARPKTEKLAHAGKLMGKGYRRFYVRLGVIYCDEELLGSHDRNTFANHFLFLLTLGQR